MDLSTSDNYKTRLRNVFHQTVITDWLRNNFIGLFQVEDFLNQRIRVVYVPCM